MSDDLHDIALVLNGCEIAAQVPARQHLADFLRQTQRLTGTHLGCEHGVCGACNVVVDGYSVRSCLTLAVQADGARVDTVEGLTDSGVLADLQAEFVARNALQCGFCTSGIMATAYELLQGPVRTRDEIRDGLSGNYCRCTGYQAIVDAIEAVMTKRSAAR